MQEENIALQMISRKAATDLIADLVTKGISQYPDIDMSEFSIARFYDKPISEFWETETDNSYSL